MFLIYVPFCIIIEPSMSSLQYRAIRAAQDEAFLESLRTDQERVSCAAGAKQSCIAILLCLMLILSKKIKGLYKNSRRGNRLRGSKRFKGSRKRCTELGRLLCT